MGELDYESLMLGWYSTMLLWERKWILNTN